MALTEAEKQELDGLRAKKSGQLFDDEPTIMEKAKAFGYGVIGGAGGGFGELEKFGGEFLPEVVGLKKPEDKPLDFGFGRSTLFPTTKEVERGLTSMGIKEPRPEVKGYQTAGELIGGFGTAIPGLARKGAKALFGAPSVTSENIARKAEGMGFKLSPTQVRQDVPLPSKGATGFAQENQTLANKLASKGTGAEVSEIDDVFIANRLKTLGGEFDKLYKNKVFNIDQDAVNAIRDIAAIETQLPTVSNVSAVKQTANQIVDNFQRLATRKGAIPNTFAVEGEALQRMRNALSEAARSTSSRGDAREIYNLIDVIDASIARNHPEVKQVLDVIRPQYRNSIILEDLYRQGGITQGNISLERLGNMLGKRRDAVRRTGMDIDELGEIGKELKLRGRFETEGRAATTGEDVLGKALSTGTDMASLLTGTRTRGARAIQRAYGPNVQRPLTPIERFGVATGAGQFLSPLTRKEEE